MAFIETGDQFLALSVRREQQRDDDRHFGLVGVLNENPGRSGVSRWLRSIWNSGQSMQARSQDP